MNVRCFIKRCRKYTGCFKKDSPVLISAPVNSFSEEIPAAVGPGRAPVMHALKAICAVVNLPRLLISDTKYTDVYEVVR